MGTLACSCGAMASGRSELGAMLVAVNHGKVIAVEFGHRDTNAAITSLRRRMAKWRGSPIVSDACEADERLAEEVLARLQRFAAGEQIDLSDIPVGMDHLSTFQRRVVKACRAIRSGERKTYGQVAAAAGSASAARAVGQVMASNRTPLVVPCHRVVAAGGGLGGFSAPDGLAMKRRLLDIETRLIAKS